MFSLFQKLVAIVESLIAIVIPFAFTTHTPVLVSSTPMIEVKNTQTPTPVVSSSSVSTSTPTSNNEAISELTKQLAELKEQISKYTPEPTPAPQIIIIQITPTPTPIATPSPAPAPTPPLGIWLIDFPNSKHKCKDYEKRIGLTQYFEMEYQGEINAEDYTWYSPWAKPTYWNGSRGQMTFNGYGEHLVTLTDKWGQKDQCRVNITE